jgi:hypothetical protein
LLGGEAGAASRSHLTLAEFGRKIGVRNVDTLRGMIEARLMRSTLVVSPSSGHERRCITAADAESFHRQ